MDIAQESKAEIRKRSWWDAVYPCPCSAFATSHLGDLFQAQTPRHTACGDSAPPHAINSLLIAQGASVFVQEAAKLRPGVDATEGPAAVRLDVVGGRFCVTGDVLAALERAAGDSLPMGRDDSKGHSSLPPSTASTAAGVVPCL